MDYPGNIRDQIHRPLAARQLWRDLIHQAADFAPYKVLCLPLAPQVSADARARLAAWVRAGGTLILGPLTGHRSDEFTAFTDREFGGFEDLIGGDSLLRHTVQWLEDVVRVVFADSHAATCRTMSESYAPRAGATVLARWQGGYADGQAAVLDHRVGKGRVITLGAFLDADSYGRVVAQACSDAGIVPMAEADAKVVIAPRCDGQGRLAGWGLCNISDRTQEVRLPRGGSDLLTGKACPDGKLLLEPWCVALVAAG
jgi:beta-galactosidase GanA